MRKIVLRILAFALITVVIANIFRACDKEKMRTYYAEKANYITAEGTVSHISYSEEFHALYIGFSELEPSFDDTCFKVVGDNYDLVLDRGIEDLLQMGDRVCFVSAPRYFGDGYVMPMVSLSLDGTTILEFDEGFANFLDWLENR